MDETIMKSSVLLIEDDERLSELIGEYLGNYEFSVSVVRTGDAAVHAVRELNPAIVILDLMLPKLDGMEICRIIRTFSKIPIIILTARADLYDQVAGLEIGADDYVLKPVEPRVLVARVRALLRRTSVIESMSDSMPPSSDRLVFGKLTISTVDRSVIWCGKSVDLKTTEYNLLLILARSAGNVLSRDDILRQLRGIEFDGLVRSVDAGICRLRKRFEDSAPEPQRIKTIWGRGYLFSPSAWEE